MGHGMHGNKREKVHKEATGCPTNGRTQHPQAKNITQPCPAGKRGSEGH